MQRDEGGLHVTTVETAVGRIGLLGGGYMGEGIVRGLVAAGLANPGQVHVCETVPVRRDELAKRHGFHTTDEVALATRGARIVLLAVKPQDFDGLALDLVHELHPKQLVISIMAGVRIETLRAKLQHERLVRAMPNTPLAIGHGYTVWTATPNITESELATVSNMFTALGGAAYFPDEKYLDMATAVSGSGPAFVMLFVEAMIDAAVLIGFKRDMATEMVLQTFAGAVRLAQESGDHPVTLRNAVTSPGGTSAAGLQALERSGVRAAIADAVVAAHERSRALGG